MSNVILVRLETVLVSVQDRCTVCIKCTMGSELFWTHLIELLGDVGHVKCHFGPFGGSANLDAI
jgi:hypothetical protein